MDSEHHDISAHILLQAEYTVMHRLVDKEVSLFTEGTSVIIQEHANWLR